MLFMVGAQSLIFVVTLCSFHCVKQFRYSIYFDGRVRETTHTSNNVPFNSGGCSKGTLSSNVLVALILWSDGS